MELTARNTTTTAASSSILVTFFKFLYSAIREAFLLKPPQISINPGGGGKVEEDACSVCMADVKVVMGRLGMEWEEDEEEEEEESERVVVGGGEEEASMAEVKRCFDVFDENGDGFIEACELQRVLVCLGLEEEGCGLEDCKRMIWAFDENGDGVIDLGEFAKLMAQISI
ncbi:PREDICTED: probable calcium-binding protein CML30 [Ipomoea nil]|uniref:probable calcium-binding protein CML30 n=1 Tax=Ipomoea nil TaxID=35883 RepID=UPI000900A199|nr:PREDICTED: probable calcium-binding protein CML30 [Ipomoea nil]